MKLEIELSDDLYRELSRAARNLKISKKRFILKAIQRMAAANQRSDAEITASLNKFFAENPDCDVRWWKDGSDWSGTKKCL